MPGKGTGVNRNTLPSWKIQRKYSLIESDSLGDFVEDWLREKRQQQKNKIINYGIYSRYQVSKLFTDLPRKKSSYAQMGKWNNDFEREEKLPHCNESVNRKGNRPSSVRIPVPNDLYKLRYKHRPRHAWNSN